MSTLEPFGLPGSRDALARAEQAQRTRRVLLHLVGGDTLDAGAMTDEAVERFRTWVDERSRDDGETSEHDEPDPLNPGGILRVTRHVRTVRFTEQSGGMASEWIVPVDKILAVEVRPV